MAWNIRSLGAILWALAFPLWPRPTQAIPAFARRYETNCTSCHLGHFPQLNALGRSFRERGYQMPDGSEDAIRARRNVEPGFLEQALTVFKEVPLSVRGQVFGLVPFDHHATPAYENRVFSYLAGGGSLGADFSAFFSWTPFPTSTLHKMHLGVHDILPGALGHGWLNFRAGSLVLLDFQRPTHRFAAPGAEVADRLAVGLNRFSLDSSQLGLQLYGRPNWGALFYELAVVAGDPGEGTERDDWKDVFARLAYTFARNTDHELTPGLFAYRGRSDMVNDFGGVKLAQRDDFWFAGAELEADVGPVNLSAMAYYRRHRDPRPQGGAVALAAGRAEALWLIAERWTVSVRYAQVVSGSAPELEAMELAPHATYALAPNVLATLAVRGDLRDFDRGSAVLVLDGVF